MGVQALVLSSVPGLGKQLLPCKYHLGEALGPLTPESEILQILGLRWDTQYFILVGQKRDEKLQVDAPFSSPKLGSRGWGGRHGTGEWEKSPQPVVPSDLEVEDSSCVCT